MILSMVLATVLGGWSESMTTPSLRSLQASSPQDAGRKPCGLEVYRSLSLLDVQRWQAQATTGEADAQCHLGVLYLNGTAVKRDDTLAVTWIMKAAEQGHAVAQRLLSQLYGGAIRSSVSRGVQRDDVAAVRWLRQAAESGDAEAQTQLGNLYAMGWGVPKDDTEAVRWELEGAKNGDIVALMYLGPRYEAGRGLPKDLSLAAKSYREAAERGDSLGMCYLADMYSVGNGVEKSAAQAYRWYYSAISRPQGWVSLLDTGQKECSNKLKAAAKPLHPADRASAERDALELAGRLPRPVPLLVAR